MVKKFIAFMLFIYILIVSCTRISGDNSSIEQEQYPEHVGDIEFDPKLDDPKFTICHEDDVFQYYNFYHSIRYKGEKYAIIETFNKRFKPSKKKETGYVTIRFVVNCEGKTGRFRTLQMDNEYRPITFDKHLVDQLNTITKSLDGWLPGEGTHATLDYYQYLTFKIEEGEIKEILP